jgi:cell division protein FtsX/septal ring factor EnvC (AmiA/AmiB activator)
MRLFYFLKCALQNIRVSRSLAFFSVVTLTLTLMLFGLFLLFYHNIQSLLTLVQRDVEFSVYLSETAVEEDVEGIKKALSVDKRVASFRYLSKDDALELFKKEFQSETLIKHLGTNPLPASFEVNVRPHYQNPEEIGQMTKEMVKFSGVEEVQYGAEWLKNFSDFLTLLRLSGLAIGGLLTVSVVTIIAHAVRLHFYDRYEEVEIMKLIGATPRFIKNPFLLEGILLGAISGGLSCAAIFGLFQFFNTHLVELGGIVGKLIALRFLPQEIIVGIILSGAILGGIGGEVSLSYFLYSRARKRSKFVVRKSAAYMLVLVLPAVLTGAPLYAKEDLSIINKHIESERKALKQLESEIGERKREKNTLKKQEESVLSTLETIDHRVRTLQTDVVSIEGKIKKKETEIQYLSSALGVLDESIEDRRSLIKKRVRMIYQEGAGSVLKVLVPMPNYPDFLKRLHYMRTIAEKESEILSLFEEEQAQLERKTNQLDGMKQQLVSTREPLVTKISEIGKEKERKHQLLARVRNEKSFYDKAIVELNESSVQLKTLIRKLEEERRKIKEVAPPPLENLNFSKVKGQLGWPNNGSVVSLFGRQKHPKFDTYVFRKGIEIETPKGDPVRSVFEGSVIFADWFKGYGMMVIMDHGENFYSVYAHLAKLLVSVGDKTEKNRTIGTVGETGLSEGNRLYFEIRHKGEPLDPLTWLQKRG